MRRGKSEIRWTGQATLCPGDEVVHMGENQGLTPLRYGQTGLRGKLARVLVEDLHGHGPLKRQLPTPVDSGKAAPTDLLAQFHARHVQRSPTVHHACHNVVFTLARTAPTCRAAPMAGGPSLGRTAEEGRTGFARPGYETGAPG